MSEGRTSALSVATDPQGRWVLGVVGKRTYSVEHGVLVPAEQQLALVEVPLLARDGLLLVHDCDLVLRRAQCDVVLAGHVYPYDGDRHSGLTLRVGSLFRRIAVFGDRRVALDALGRPVFSSPEPFERIPLGWEHAYGGYDAAALEAYGDPSDDLRREAGMPLTPETGFYAYPRNPVGRGYLVELSPAGVARCMLPNLEDPEHLLTPDTLVYGNSLGWPEGPPPAGTGWMPHAFFPRMTLLGLPPPAYDDERFPPESFWEVRMGLLPARSLDPTTHVAALFDLRGAQSSAPGMRVDTLLPGDPVELTHAHPRQARWTFALPPQPPRMVYRLPGGDPQPLIPQMRTVVLEPDLDRVSIVWVAEAPLSLLPTPEQLDATQHAVLWEPPP